MAKALTTRDVSQMRELAAENRRVAGLLFEAGAQAAGEVALRASIQLTRMALTEEAKINEYRRIVDAEDFDPSRKSWPVKDL